MDLTIAPGLVLSNTWQWISNRFRTNLDIAFKKVKIWCQILTMALTQFQMLNFWFEVNQQRHCCKKPGVNHNKETFHNKPVWFGGNISPPKILTLQFPKSVPTQNQCNWISVKITCAQNPYIGAPVLRAPLPLLLFFLCYSCFCFLCFGFYVCVFSSS